MESVTLLVAAAALIVGIPAKAISDLHPVQVEHNRENAETYCKLALEHAKEAD